MDKLLALVDNKYFRIGLTVFSFGFGGYLLWKDLKDWYSKSDSDVQGNPVYNALISGSLFDNGIVMAMSTWKTKNDYTWRLSAMSFTV